MIPGMKTGKIIGLGILGFIAVLAMWFVSTSNSLVTKDEAVKAAWSQVENTYQRRMDLIPNLVNTVKGYAAHEKETLESVIQARNQAASIASQTSGGSAGAPAQDQLKRFQQAQDQLAGALSRLMVVVERYPELKANENFRDLQVSLEGTENRIAVERKRFNEVAQDYNTYLRSFPQSIVAGFRGFNQRGYFEAAQGANVAPKVQF